MHIFVISLKDAIERREHVNSQFTAIQQDFEFFDAVDGRKEKHPLFSKYNVKKRLRYKGYELTAGELGCFASHYLLWEKCVELNDTIIVIEDDVQLETCFKESIKDAQQLAQYEYLRLFVNNRYRPFIKIAEYKEYDVVEYQRGPSGARAYLITPMAAQKLINMSQEWFLPVDDYMDQFWLNKVVCRGLMPGIVKNETDFESCIGTLNRSKKAHRMTREIYSMSCTLKRKWHLLTHSSKKID
jgi:glycosyl transferase family 25